MITRVEIVNDFLAINVKVGETIQEIVEKAGSGLPFGCRDGECGTCLVSVLSGMEFLSPLTEKEKKVKETVGCTDPNVRLSCQMKVSSQNGHVRLKY